MPRARSHIVWSSRSCGPTRDRSWRRSPFKFLLHAARGCRLVGRGDGGIFGDGHRGVCCRGARLKRFAGAPSQHRDGQAASLFLLCCSCCLLLLLLLLLYAVVVCVVFVAVCANEVRCTSRICAQHVSCTASECRCVQVYVRVGLMLYRVLLLILLLLRLTASAAGRVRRARRGSATRSCSTSSRRLRGPRTRASRSASWTRCGC